MADRPVDPLPGIAALPPTTVRQIGSGQVLVDPSFVVKELIDNALDARARSIFVDITANTIDTIQVKDDGHGIPSIDRPLVCRRYCTSKIRDFEDLKEVGGKWLGFRGEALSSMAEMSSSLSVTTRVEGETVAVKLKYRCDGELDEAQRESHPVGTTVKVTGFFDHAPVRRQTAIRQSSKCLATIRRLMQAYALARPSVRFRFHVLKGKNNKIDFHYAPSSKATREDTALKVIGRDCALQCDWTTLETGGFEIQAFLPKPTANGSKIANLGAFISIDARPVSGMRGTAKKLVKSFKTRLRETRSSLTGVKEPFIYVNIICPPDSYDPNIEPAKDDVMFDREDVILDAFNRLMHSYYPETAAFPEDDIIPTSAQRSPTSWDEEIPAPIQTPVQAHKENAYESHEKPHWRSSMYDLDEDDIHIAQDEQPPVVEDEECIRATEVSNPWTIARMNAAVRPRKFPASTQLMSPEKTQYDGSLISSPIPVITPRRACPLSPLTPQSTSKQNDSRLLNEELKRSIHHVISSPSTREIMHQSEHIEKPDALHNNSSSNQVRQYRYQSLDTDPFQNRVIKSTPQTSRLPILSTPPRSQRTQQQARVNKPFVSPAAGVNDTWFGQPMRGSSPQKISRSQGNSKVRDITIPLTKHTIDKTHTLNSNTDIRDFYRNKNPQQRTQPNLLVLPSTPRPQLPPTEEEEEEEEEEESGARQQLHTSPAWKRNSPTSPASPISPSNPASPTTHTQSPMQPLERTTPAPHTRPVIYTIETNIEHIIHRARSIDVQRDGPAWGYRFPCAGVGAGTGTGTVVAAAAAPTTSVFAAPVSVRRLAQWVAVLQRDLGARYEQARGVDVGRVLGAGVTAAVRACGSVEGGRGNGQGAGWEKSPCVVAVADIDALTPGVLGDDTHATTTTTSTSTAPEEELADEVEDDMLLDL